MLDHYSLLSAFVVVAVVCLFISLCSCFLCCSCWFCRGFFIVAVVACLFDLLVCQIDLGLFVVSESDVLSSLVSFFYFPFFLSHHGPEFTLPILFASPGVGGRGAGGVGPATVQLHVPCTGCWEPSSFASDSYAAVCKGEK